MASGCEALNARGVRCREAICYPVDLGDAGVRQLCRYHRRLSSHRPMALWDRPLQPADYETERTPMRPWTPDDDARLLSHAGEPAAAVAPLLNRTTMAVWQRRSRLRRRAASDGGPSSS